MFDIFFNQHLFDICYVSHWARWCVDEQLPNLIRVENKLYPCAKSAHPDLSCDTTTRPSRLHKLILTLSNFVPTLGG